MTEQTQIDLSAIQRISTLLDILSHYDPTLSIGALQMLIAVAISEAEGEPVTPTEILRMQGLSASAVTRGIQYWGNHLNVTIDSKDRRQRRIALTGRGRAFLAALIQPIT